MGVKKNKIGKYIAFISLIITLFSCKKEKAYIYFYQNTKSLEPIEIYINRELKGEVYESREFPKDCFDDSNALVIELMPGVEYEIITKMRSLADTFMIKAEADICNVIEIE